MHVHFALDFDGTISPVDTTDLLLEAFADPGWHDIEVEWTAGRIGSRECLSRQIALLDAGAEDIATLLDGVRLDPAFPAFVAAVQAAGATVSIVSDGFDRSIHHLLHRAGIDLPVVSNRLAQMGIDRWRAEFSASGEGCASGTCKCAAVPSDRPVILVGDGRSDFCLARQASFVLAKGALAQFCAAQGIPHHAITGFADALASLERLPAIASAHPYIQSSVGDFHA